MYEREMVENGADPRLYILESVGIFDKDRPEKVYRHTSSPYHRKRLTKATRLLKKLKGMTVEAALKLTGENADVQFKEDMERYLENLGRQQEACHNLRRMVSEVEEWKPPAEDRGTKERALEMLKRDLEVELRWDPEKPERPKDGQALGQWLDRLQQDVAYHAENWKKEREGARRGNKRTYALLKSVGLTRAEAERLKQDFLATIKPPDRPPEKPIKDAPRKKPGGPGKKTKPRKRASK